MKKSTLFLLVVFLSMSCLARPKANNELQTSKVDVRLKSAYEDLINKNELNKKLECFIKLSEKVDEEKLAVLKDAGFETRTYTRTILTGSFKVKDLANITNVDFVKYIELAVPMNTK